jgi:hypothetical protein
LTDGARWAPVEGTLKMLLRAAGVLAALGLGPTALASDWVDTRLSFVFADDNLLAAAGETTPSSPAARFGATNANTQFYDNFNTRFSGFETLSNLVLYKQAPAFFEGLSSEAALSVLLLERPSGEITLRDNSSYIRLAFRPPGWGERENLSFTGFPVSADRFRLGYAYRISWGGSPVFGGDAFLGGVPGAKLQLTRDRWYAFAGAKTALLLNPLIQERETQYGGMGGAGVDITPWLRLEAGGGYFQKGVVPGLAVQGVNAPVNAWGGSAQAVFHDPDVPVGTSVDFRLYRNDPEVFQRFFAPEAYPGGFSYAASIEGSYLVQTLADPDVFARQALQSAQAVAVQGRIKYDYLRAHLLALYRTLSFIQFNVPSFPPYNDFPDGTRLTPEMFVAVGLDYHLPRLHLTPGIIFGVQRAASFTSPETVLGGGQPPQQLTAGRTVVVRDVNLFSILPPGQDPLPILSAKATTKWDISDYIAAIGELYWTRDPNRASFADDVTGVAQFTFEREDAVGFNLILQARF